MIQTIRKKKILSSKLVFITLDQLEDIKQILDKVYGNELSQLKNMQKVNLFLNAIDFQAGTK